MASARRLLGRQQLVDPSRVGQRLAVFLPGLLAALERDVAVESAEPRQVHLREAGLATILLHAPEQHGKRRRNAVGLEVVAVALHAHRPLGHGDGAPALRRLGRAFLERDPGRRHRRQRALRRLHEDLLGARAIVGQTDEGGAVGIRLGRAAAVVGLAEDEGRPFVGQIDVEPSLPARLGDGLAPRSVRAEHVGFAGGQPAARIPRRHRWQRRDGRSGVDRPLAGGRWRGLPARLTGRRERQDRSHGQNDKQNATNGGHGGFRGVAVQASAPTLRLSPLSSSCPPSPSSVRRTTGASTATAPCAPTRRKGWTVYPVNPREPTVEGLRAYPTVRRAARAGRPRVTLRTPGRRLGASRRHRRARRQGAMGESRRRQSRVAGPRRATRPEPGRGLQHRRRQRRPSGPRLAATVERSPRLTPAAHASRYVRPELLVSSRLGMGW